MNYQKAEEICNDYDLDVMTIKTLKYENYIKMHIPEDAMTEGMRYWIGAKQKWLPKLTYVHSGISIGKKYWISYSNMFKVSLMLDKSCFFFVPNNL